MQTGLRGRDLVSTRDWSRDELDTVLAVARDLKRRRALGEPHALLEDKVLAMLFFFSSTRTRASFEAGMAQLGGHAQFIESQSTQIAHGDTAREIGEILGRYNDGLAIRQCDWDVGNDYIRAVAAASRVPVLNMQCDRYHPFQALADLLTIVEHKTAGVADLHGLTVDVSWAYAASYVKPLSVPQSLILLLTRYGADVRLTHPEEFRLQDDVLEQAGRNAAAAGGSLTVGHDFDAGFDGADVVYPKSWGCMLTTTDEDEAARIGGRYDDWIADEARMGLAADDAIYLHCLPADRGVEVADAVIDGPHSRVYDEAENRLHVQKAVMALTM